MGVDSYEGGPGNDVIIVDYFDFTNGKEPPDQAVRTMAQAQGVFDGGENDDGTARTAIPCLLQTFRMRMLMVTETVSQ